MSTQKAVKLALQGGGAHGAFTWGVLDYLLEDGRLAVDAISGTSAGAINGVLVADGLMRDGGDGARERLATFWHHIGRSAQFSPFRRSHIDAWMGNWNLDFSPGFVLFDLLNRVASPYQLNPLNINPLRDILQQTVDFERVRHCNKTHLFISATNVETGRVKVFDHRRLTVDMVLASACLPYLFQAVEIDDVPYWDGGYMGNPVLFPFFADTPTTDIVIVQINPVERPGVPKSAVQIMNRVNEITFNSSLLKELRAVDFVHRLIEQGKLDQQHYTDVYVHIIDGACEMLELSASSKMNAEQAFLEHLFEIGRRTAESWLALNHDHIGSRSTVNLRAMFQGDETTNPQAASE